MVWSEACYLLPYDADKLELENKIPDTTGLVKKTDYDTKTADMESEIRYLLI